jgi:hypothetical protein
MNLSLGKEKAHNEGENILLAGPSELTDKSDNRIPGANSFFRRLHRKVRCIGGMILRRSYEDSVMNLSRNTRDSQSVLFGVCCRPND